MTDRLWLDIETRSRQDLKRVGVYRYAACPDFRILMCGYSTDSDNVDTLIDQDDIADLVSSWTGTIVAHNAAFERICFSRLILGPGKFLDPDRFHDTQSMAGIQGRPQSLDALAKRLKVTEKDSAGTRLINLFCKPRRDGGWNDHTTHPMEWLDFIAYCEQDVRTLIAVDDKLGDFPADERAVYIADQLINDRGIRIDVELAEQAHTAALVNEREQGDAVRVLTDTPNMNANSVKQLTEWLEEQGLDVPNLQAETVRQLLLDPTLSVIQRKVLELRQELALAAPAKFSSALDRVGEDDRLRGSFRFFGAHTGRWSGSGTQLQNLPRAAFKTDGEQDAAILDLRLGLGGSSLTLKKLVRPMFLGPFTVVDYSAIEARVIAWLAGETWALDAFRAGRDIYVETQKRAGLADRFQGKIAVLALGFGGAINSFRAMMTTEQNLQFTDAELVRIVKQWRKANKRIVDLWSMLEGEFEDGGKVGDHLRITRRGNSRFLELPSGRAIAYHDCKVRRRKHNGRVSEGWTYWGREPYPIDTYGGRLAENATQAVARDLLAAALVRLEDQGYPVVGHVHDEVIVEGEHDVEEIKRIMCELPDWARGLPVDGEGFVCKRYRKG